jgi:hypothetical protein
VAQVWLDAAQREDHAPASDQQRTSVGDTQENEMTKDEALDLALETLESIQAAYPCETVGKRITAIKQARSAQQEPVAWMSASRFEELRKGFTVMTTLTKQRAFEDDVEIHTTLPAQRQWVGLTDDERVDLWKATETDNRMVLIDAIEAKLKEKNT